MTKTGFQSREALYQFISYNIVEPWASCSKKIILHSNSTPLLQISIALFDRNPNRSMPIKTTTPEIIKIKKKDVMNIKNKSNFKIKRFFKVLSLKYWQMQTVQAFLSSSTTWCSPRQTAARLRPTKIIADNNSNNKKSARFSVISNLSTR